MATAEEKENLVNIANEQELTEEMKTKLTLDLDDLSNNESIEDTRLTLDELFILGQKYFKEHTNDNQLSHSDRLKLKSFIKQAKHGKYQPNLISDCIYSENIGNQRINYWESLGDMSQEDVMKTFLEVLINLMPDFISYVRSHNGTLEGATSESNEDSSDDERQEYEMLLKREELRLKDVKMKKRIKDRLDQQTALQYRQYAKQQVPDNEAENLRSFFHDNTDRTLPPESHPLTPRQEALIEQLQEQHYEQYIEQVHNQQLIHQRQQYYQIQLAIKSKTGMNNDNGGNINAYFNVQNKNNSNEMPKLISPTKNITAAEGMGVETDGGGDNDDGDRSGGGKNDPVVINKHNEGGVEGGDEGGGDDDDDGEGVVVDDDAFMYNMPPLIPASIWTRSDIREFKESVRKSPENCIKVGSLSTATVKVPTHEDGTSLFWEFATDYYDLGFGLYFEWTINPQPDVTVHVCESSDEEDVDEDAEAAGDKNDVEKGSRHRKEGPPMDEIIQIYRRDCHEEVYCGSHLYPGRGIYHLKFDNSYSLWRSKTVYYKVFYSK